MPRFIESIKLLNGAFFNLEYHQLRINRTGAQFFPHSKIPDLQFLLDEIEKPVIGLFKCRIVYDQEIHSIEFNSYQIKPIHSLKIVRSDAIDYDFKFENRDHLNELYHARAETDDIVIVKNGLVTDSSYANLIFKKGDKWVTSSSYLLNGTMRQQLIKSGEISCETITQNDIRTFDKVKLINSMIGMDGPEIEVLKVIL